MAHRLCKKLRSEILEVLYDSENTMLEEISMFKNKFSCILRLVKFQDKLKGNVLLFDCNLAAKLLPWLISHMSFSKIVLNKESSLYRRSDYFE